MQDIFLTSALQGNVLGVHSSMKTINQSGFDNERQTQLALCNCNHIKRLSGVVLVSLVEKHLSKYVLTEPCIIFSNKKSQPLMHFTLCLKCTENETIN